MSKVKLKAQPKLIERRYIGLQVLTRGKLPPMAYALYTERYSDGTVKSSRGYSLSSAITIKMLNGTSTQKKRAKQVYRSDLQPVIEAAAVLNRALTNACLELDAIWGYGEYRSPE